MIALIVSAVMTCFTPATSAQTQITEENLRDVHVRAAIDAIVAELYDRKDRNTFWEPRSYSESGSSQKGGYTALIVLSLLYAGETYQDEGLADAITYLENTKMEGTYAVAVRTNVWALLPPKFQPQLEQDVQWLIDAFSDKAGGWNYGMEPNTTRRDNSITQYGALALWEAAKRGLRIDGRFWEAMEQRFINMQLADGGWNYSGRGGATGSMTTAGLTALFITQDFLHAHEAVKLSQGRQNPNQAAIERGIEWMDTNFSSTTNPGRDTDYFYYMYGVERVGIASGYKFFREVDWYRAGSAAIINKVCKWNPQDQSMTVHEKMDGNSRAGSIRDVDLAFSLMFLSRGRVPVSVNKLSGSDFAWNNRPRDVANLTRRISARTEKGLNWQIVSADASAEEWLDASLLYVASNAALPWLPNDSREVNELADANRAYRAAIAAGDDAAGSPLENLPMLAKLKRYLDLGGLLFANAEGRNKAFGTSVERIGSVLYPHYEWRNLPPDHPAYTMYQQVTSSRPPLRALSNGVRELIILSPSVDFSEAFQSNSDADDARIQTATNIFLYASEMNRALPRVDTQMIDASAVRVGSASATIVLASHAGAWDTEAAALETFSNWAWQERGLNLAIDVQPLAKIATLDDPAALVIVAGVDAAELTAAETGAIETFVNAGGVILFETTGGRGGFTAGAEQKMQALLGKPVRSLLRHVVISGDDIAGSQPMRRVEYRPFSREVFGARESAARLRGMLFDKEDEARVLFSREDLLFGQLAQPNWGVSGYTSNDARNLLANIVQYAASLQ